MLKALGLERGITIKIIPEIKRMPRELVTRLTLTKQRKLLVSNIIIILSSIYLILFVIIYSYSPIEKMHSRGYIYYTRIKAQVIDKDIHVHGDYRGDYKVITEQ